MFRKTTIVSSCVLLSATLAVRAQKPANSAYFVIDTTTTRQSNGGSDRLEKTLFTDGGVLFAFLGDGTFSGQTGQADAPGGAFLYQKLSSGSDFSRWSAGCSIASGDFYERSLAVDLNGNGHPDIIASRNGQLVRLKNPGNPTRCQPWAVEVINPNSGAHDLKVADIDGDGLLDIVVSGSTILGNAGDISFHNGDGSWTNVRVTAPAGIGDGIDIISVGGSPSIVGVDSASDHLVFWQNPRDSGNDARSQGWAEHYIGAAPEGNSLAVGTIVKNGPSDVVTCANEQTWSSGCGWYEPANGYFSPWIWHSLSTDWDSVHQIDVFDINGDGVNDLVIAAQEQFPDARTVVYYGDGSGNFLPQTLTRPDGVSPALQNQVVFSYNAQTVIAGAAHGAFAPDNNPFEGWSFTAGTSVSSSPELPSGVYSLSDAQGWAQDAGFYSAAWYWGPILGTPLIQVYEEAQTSGNGDQQWQVTALGNSTYSICNVQHQGACLTDATGQVQIGQGSDPWKFLAQGPGSYLIQNARTGDYMQDPDRRQAMVTTSSAKVGWLVGTPR